MFSAEAVMPICHLCNKECGFDEKCIQGKEHCHQIMDHLHGTREAKGGTLVPAACWSHWNRSSFMSFSCALLFLCLLISLTMSSCVAYVEMS